MRDAFEVIAQAMCEIVERIDAPLRAGLVVIGVADAVKQGVAQPDIGRRHIDLGAERTGAVGEFAGSHPLEEHEVFLNATVTERTVFARLVGRAAVSVGVGRVEIADVGLATLDEFQGAGVEGVKVVAGKKRFDGGCAKRSGGGVVICMAVDGASFDGGAFWLEA